MKNSWNSKHFSDVFHRSGGNVPVRHGVSHSHEAVIPANPKRMGQESQAYGTRIPSVWDRNPKRMGQESQTYGTEIPSVWDENPKRLGLNRDSSRMSVPWDSG